MEQRRKGQYDKESCHQSILPIQESGISGRTTCCQKTREFYGDSPRIVHLLPATSLILVASDYQEVVQK